MKSTESLRLRKFDRYQLVTWVALVYFGLRLVYLATHLSPYVPPDEETHVGMCRLFQTTCLIPDNTAESFAYGQVSHQPYLYYWLMGRLLALNFIGISDLIFLRLANVAIAIAAVVLGLLWIRLVSDNRATQALFVILLTNTPMYTVVGASVTYDNLTMATAVWALYHLHRFKRQPRGADLLVAVFAVLAGTLTKKAFLPLAALYSLWGGYLVFRAVRGGWGGKDAAASVFSIQGLAWAVLIPVLLILNLSLYGGNLWRFGRLIPATDQVLTVDQAMQYRIYARNRVVSLYREGRISYEQALQMTSQIRHRGDRRAAVYLLKIAKRSKNQPDKLMNRGQYALFWWQKMLEGLVGIIGHRTMLKPSGLIVGYHVFFGLAILFLVTTWKLYQPRSFLVDAAVIFGFYALVLMQGVNYSVYQQFHSPVLALQGRYLLPVIVPLYGLVACGYVEPLKSRGMQALVVIMVGSFFIYGDFIYFLQHVDASWYLDRLP